MLFNAVCHFGLPYYHTANIVYPLCVFYCMTGNVCNAMGKIEQLQGLLSDCSIILNDIHTSTFEKNLLD